NPLGKTVREWSRPNGIKIKQVRVPIGVIGIIYESRPNVTVDASVLCLKTGNAVILRGGSEAIHSNRALTDALQAGAKKGGLLETVVQLIPMTDREAIPLLCRQDDCIDLMIPRGGEGLIRTVTEHARMPVIKHYNGICHVYVHEDADFRMAENIILNAKCQRPGVCNALETLLIDEKIASIFVPRIVEALKKNQVEIRGDEATQKWGGAEVIPAIEADWTTESLDLILSLKVVKGVDDAIAHMEKYGSKHSDAIVTNDEKVAEKFLNEVDSATVYWNASTRFTDGGEFGFGAEIGISTDKLHARGPMGLDELTSYKYQIVGCGQIRE
ncbi:MAG: glutamate-5-semialdehyde dehydrogenase, partial [Verrucomicrobiota bacterium]